MPGPTSITRSTSSLSPPVSPISSAKAALVLLSSATAVASSAITPGVAANPSNTALAVVGETPSSTSTTSQSLSSSSAPAVPVSTSSAAQRAASAASESAPILGSSSVSAISSESTSVAPIIPTPSASTSNAVLTPSTSIILASSLPSSSNTAVSSSTTITDTSSSTTSLLTASGSPTSETTISSSAIPSSILILPTTTASTSSSASSVPSSSSTSPTTATATPSSTSNPTAHTKLSSPEIVGISFGAIAAAAILSLILFTAYRRRRARLAASTAVEHEDDTRDSRPDSAWLYNPRMKSSAPATPATVTGEQNHGDGGVESRAFPAASAIADTTPFVFPVVAAAAAPAATSTLPKRQVSDPLARALTSNPPTPLAPVPTAPVPTAPAPATSAVATSKRHTRISTHLAKVAVLPTIPHTPTTNPSNTTTLNSAAAANEHDNPTLATPTSPKLKRESLPAILKIGHGKRVSGVKARPVTTGGGGGGGAGAALASGSGGGGGGHRRQQQLQQGPSKPLPARPWEVKVKKEGKKERPFSFEAGDDVGGFGVVE